MADQQQTPGLLANVLAVAGFIVLIIIIVWGAYHLLRLTGTGVSSLFSRFGNSNEITINVPTAPVQSGKSFPLSWEYEHDDAGTYAFLYQCKAGFRFDLPTPSGSSAAVPCGNAFMVGENTSLTLVPTLSGTSSVDVPFTVVFMPNATSSDERPQGTATVNVVATSGGTQAPRPSTPTTSTPSTSTPQTNGTPDLAVNILAVGVVDQWGNFIARAPLNAGEIAAIKFDIKNSGTASTGAWYFNVTLPVQGGYVYSSQAQMSLAPGARIENILRFRPVQSGGGTVTINVDAPKMVSESNEGNNSAAVWMNAGNFPYQYVQPYVY